MLRRCPSTVRSLGGYVRTTRVSYSADAYKLAINKPDRKRSGSHTSTHKSDKTKRVAQGLTSACIPDHRPPRHAHNPTPVNNAPPLRVSQTDHLMHMVSVAHPREPNHGRYIYPEHTTPVDILRRFLSQKDCKSCSPQTYDSDALSSLFTSVRTAGHLKKLGQGHLSSLISLFGTLSIYPARARIYTNTLVSQIKNQPHRTYWSFIAQVAMEIEISSQRLTHSDYYWLMRADLAIVNSLGQGALSDSDTRKKHDAMSRAQHEYRYICRHSNDPEVHGPYFEALLSLQTPEHLRQAAEDLCELLSWSYVLQHSRILPVLWHIVLRTGSDFSDESKEALLAVTIRRLWRHARKLPDTTKGSDASTKHSVSGIHASGIVGLADMLTAVIISPLPSSTDDESHLAAYKWALSEALAVFAPHVSFAHRWNSLVLLAHYNTAPAHLTSNLGTIIQENRHYAKVAQTDWDVICVLATIEKSTSRIRPPDSSANPFERNVQEVDETLWAKWCEGPTNRSKRVSRAIAVSFFRLATIAKDVTLATAVDRHCILSGLWNIDDNDTSDAAQVASLATEYIWVSFNCDPNSLEHVVAELHDSFNGRHWESMIKQIFLNFTHQDIRIASKLYSLVCGTTKLPMDTIHLLAISLTSKGFVNVALPFFRDQRITQSQRRDLLIAVLLALAKRQSAILHPDVASVVGDEMQISYAASPPAQKSRAVIQHILPALASSGHAAKAGAIFETIHGASPSFFARAFTMRFLPVLIRHRQFRLVTRVLKSLTKSRPRRMGPLRKVGLLGLSRGGAITSAAQANSTTWAWKTSDIMVRMAHGVKFRTSTPLSELSLKSSSTAGKYAFDGPATQFAMRILVRAGRILAAKRLFLRTREHLDPPVRTSLGNVILDGYSCQLQTQTGRHMRKVLLAYDSLILEGGMVPDRVTVNTMLKAILRWRIVMDSAKLRVLFDHMVRNGYPGGAETRHGQVPFGTSISNPQVFRLPQLDPPMSFERHIRPMLKMFIKAFHVRTDVAAARQVIGILKSEEKAIMEKRDRRRRARNVGKMWIDGSLTGHQ